MHDLSIHQIGQVVGSYVARKVSRHDEAEFLAYGAEIIIGSIFKISILFLVAAILDVVPEVTIILLVTGLVRTLSGGAHCSAYYRCLITSVLILNALGYIIRIIYPHTIQLPKAVLPGMVVLCIYLYWCYAPQAPLNKPFENRKMELAFRWYTLITVIAFSVISIILGTSSLISWTIALALLWQSFTLTPVGHRFIESLDYLFTSRRKEARQNVKVHD